jgi:hypothetical protein
MPSVSGPQHRAMAAAMTGHSNLGIPASVGRDFVTADKGRKFPLPGKPGKQQFALKRERRGKQK